jgi:hypothetical protein
MDSIFNLAASVIAWYEIVGPEGSSHDLINKPPRTEGTLI